ncbi:MAG: hypothetical protein ISS45_01210 [Candidatus Omnitrophica bacterium]|nr:hypothetical protein [Candidatus Omnitrophota bacterium]
MSYVNSPVAQLVERVAVNEAATYGAKRRKLHGGIDPEFWRDEFRKKFGRRLKRGVKKRQLSREIGIEKAG